MVALGQPAKNKDHGVNTQMHVEKLHGFVITIIRTPAHHTRLLAELEAHDGFSDSQEEMTEEQHGTLPCQGCYLLPLNFP